MKDFEVYHRQSADIPHGKAYIIKDDGCYTASYTIYGVTFRKEFKSYNEANKYLNTYNKN